jgi:hypothetical protein
LFPYRDQKRLTSLLVPSLSCEAFLHKKEIKGTKVWELLQQYQKGNNWKNIDQLLQVAYLLEEHKQVYIYIYLKNATATAYPKFSRLLSFYTSPEVHPKQIKCTPSIFHQLSSTHNKLRKGNHYNTLQQEENPDTMQESEIASSTEHTQPSQANPNDIRKPQPGASTEYWVQDTSLSTIAELITLQLEQDKKEPSQGSVLEDQLP